MFLRSLVIKGFKTFADREEIAFDNPSGITAIVGPNGCGKSNVVDAFRFVLGESNIRELRVHSVPEVIFAGTEARKPLSMAEVTLNFDNSDQRLRVEYSDVSVKRRTFRDGESEFLINNQAGRLKDIRDMFLDTGISTESLSIISQGKVDAILSSKPEERRSVFEEVAGINKYRFRKMEAERKLILSEQNLLRISDLKVEVGEQLVSLEAQARAAREYKDIQASLRRLELSTLKKQARGLMEKKEAAEKELEIMRRKAKERLEQFRRLKEDRGIKQQELIDLDSEISALSAGIDRVKDRMEEERGNLIIEKERHLFEEKGKLRDLKEEERFIRFEARRLEEAIKGLEEKEKELQGRGREISARDLGEFGDLGETIRLTVELSRKLREVIKGMFGKSWDELKEDSKDEQFMELLQAELGRVRDEAGSQKEELKFKREKLAEAAERIAGAEERVAELEKRTEDFTRAPQGEEMDRLASEKNGLLEKLEAARSKKESISSELRSLEEFAFDQSVSDGQTPELLRQEVALAKIEGELSGIESQIRDEYQMTVAELLAHPEEAGNVGKGRKEIESLRARLRELEPVNLIAIEEYDRCRERHEFIEAQHGDIVLARENLKTLMTELDLKAREDFLRSIETVARNFAEVFSMLFEGGEAQIVMESGKDALEAGIDISVRPSGRKWLNMALLSGGERSLTAIALLFAILKTSPSPFCILDEVDAALDDANIGRFVSYLKTFSRNTQIFVITHNKRTMEVADTIYGVTMEEPGISKVVSMKLTKTA